MGYLKDRYKILVCGDSISKGIIYDKNINKYIRSEDMYVNIVKKHIKADMFNTACFGNTVQRAKQRFCRDLCQKDPDIVVIELGGNDCDFNWNEINIDPEGFHRPNTDIDEYKDSLGDIVKEVRSNGKKPVLFNLIPLDPERYFNWICKEDNNKKINILKWLGSISKIYWWQERYNTAVMEVARLTNTLMIDIRGAFLQKSDFREYLCEDGIHPNEKGHEIIADRILNYIKSRYSFICAQ